MWIGSVFTTQRDNTVNTGDTTTSSPEDTVTNSPIIIRFVTAD